ncbi:MAG: penicillin acylase family protein [Ferruginibacter sp.]
MKLLKLFIFFCPLFFQANAQKKFSDTEINRWKKQATQVEIIRDQWGIPHIYGNTDADAVFGLMYAQCEDDFMRVEMNYIEKLGRTAEIKGQDALYADLQMRMLIDSADAVNDYSKSPLWLKKLLNAFADGINFYLYKNVKVKPALLTRFKPWYPLLWTDGSIGAINTAGVTEAEFKNFYSGNSIFNSSTALKEPDPTGSNGFAFAPSISTSGNAMLYINPHVTFYFRPEVHMVSKEGLNTYGAVTWGQFFVYQGFNEFCGWMHTSSVADVADLYQEDVQNNTYRYEQQRIPIVQKLYQLFYTTDSGILKKSFTGYFTHHGSVLASRNNKWLALKTNNRSLKSTIQSWQRTKAKSFNDYKKSMQLGANTSNNTVYADAAGNIAYWHGNFMPVRDTAFNWNNPVDGSTSKTEWKGMHKIEDLVYTINPPNGWLQNCNSTPFTVAGKNSPDRKKYPAYMAPDAENFRGLNAVNVLSAKNKYTLDEVIAAGYDKHLTAFDSLLPALIRAWHMNTVFSPDTALGAAINYLENWDKNVDENSVALSLAIHWAEKILPSIIIMPKANVYYGLVDQTSAFIMQATATQLLQPLKAVLEDLAKRNGKWDVTWGSINRFQRISNGRDLQFDDAKKSLPVAFVSSTWGMLPSYSSSLFAGTKYRYGMHGNSFIAAVEFGKKIKAKSLLAGGESGQFNSPHFFDQGNMYTEGTFKEVLFYKEDVIKNAARRYHPGG